MIEETAHQALPLTGHGQAGLRGGPGARAGDYFVGLAGWRCRLHLDVPNHRRFVSEEYSVSGATGEAEAESELRVHEDAHGLIWVSWHRNEGTCPLPAFLSAPEGARFVRLPHQTRHLYQDTMAGERPVIEACGHSLVMLAPELLGGYLPLIATWILLQEHPSVRLHSAVLSVEDTSLVLIGPSGKGKSTLSWALAQRGAIVYSDESAFFGLNTFRLVAGPRSLNLRPGGMALLEAPPGGTWIESRPGDPKVAVALPPPERGCPQGRILLLFLQGFGDTPCLRPMPGQDAILALTRGMAFGPPSIGARLEVAADLLNRFPYLSLMLGRPDETAAMLIAYIRGYDA